MSRTSVAEAAAEVVRLAVKAGVASTKVNFSRVTDGETECGAWRVTVERISPPGGDDEAEKRKEGTG